MAVRSKSMIFGSCEMSWIVCGCRWRMIMIQRVDVMLYEMRM